MIIAMLATIVVVLLFSPVKSAIQNALDRAFYRDKYDYRRALVGFARDLNSDLDLDRLGERLVARHPRDIRRRPHGVMLADEASGDYEMIRARGFNDVVVPVSNASRRSRQPGRRRCAVARRSALARRSAAGGAGVLGVRGVHYFVPCVAKGGTIAVLALGQRNPWRTAEQRRHGPARSGRQPRGVALEKGRSIVNSQLKAGELQRLQEFNENIVESLDDAASSSKISMAACCDGTSALEQILRGLVGDRRRRTRLEEVFDGPFVEALRPLSAIHPQERRCIECRSSAARGEAGETLRVNVATAPLRAPSEVAAVDGWQHHHHRRRHGARAPRRAASDFDKMASVGLLAAGVAHEVNYSAHRHLELSRRCC
jgi:hypothetical protein